MNGKSGSQCLFKCMDHYSVESCQVEEHLCLSLRNNLCNNTSNIYSDFGFKNSKAGVVMTMIRTWLRDCKWTTLDCICPVYKNTPGFVFPSGESEVFILRSWLKNAEPLPGQASKWLHLSHSSPQSLSPSCLGRGLQPLVAVGATTGAIYLQPARNAVLSGPPREQITSLAFALKRRQSSWLARLVCVKYRCLPHSWVWHSSQLSIPGCG